MRKSNLHLMVTLYLVVLITIFQTTYIPIKADAIPAPQDVQSHDIKNKVKNDEVTKETTVSLKALRQSHYDRWQEVDFDFANMEDIYNSLTYPLAKVIFAESGGSNNDTLQQYVGYVFINLLNCRYYPDTVEGVLKRCYAETTQDRFYEEKCSKRALKNAQIVVNNYYNSTMPVSPALIYQAEFKQGVNSFKIENEYFGYDQRILNNL